MAKDPKQRLRTLAAKAQDLALDLRDLYAEMERGTRVRVTSSRLQDIISASDLADAYPEVAGLDIFLETAKFRRVYADLRDTWQKNLPAVDIERELRRAHVYAAGKKAQGRPYVDYVRYVNSWMLRAADTLAKETRLTRPEGEPAGEEQADLGEGRPAE